MMLTSRRWKQSFLAAVLLLIVVVGVKHGIKASTPSRLGTMTRTAFLRWREMVNDLVAGVNVYDGSKYVYPYPNPPIMGVLLWPLEQLPPLVGVMFWFTLKTAMAATAFVWVFRLCRANNRLIPPRGDPLGASRSRKPVSGAEIVGTVAVLLALHPILSDLSHGNVNIFIAFLVFAGLELYRRHWDLSAGLVLALAVACKVTPAIFLAFFVWKRAWRAVAGSVIGLSLWVLIVPGAALGWSHNLDLLQSWYTGMVRPFLVEWQVTSERANQSIPGVVFRLFTSGKSTEIVDDDDEQYSEEFHTLIDLGPDAARWIIRGFQAGFVLLVVTLCRCRERSGLRFASECGLMVLGMLLFSERTWKHHGVVLMLPIAVVTMSYLMSSPGSIRRRVLSAALLLFAILTLIPSMLGDAGQDFALIYGSYTVAYLMLLSVMVSNLLILPRSPPDAPVRDSLTLPGS